MPQIEVKNLSFAYDPNPKGKQIISDISWSLSDNESIGIIGANGVGKSTLLKLLVGLNLNYEGSIQVGGFSVTKNNLKHIRKTIGYVFQDSDSQLFTPTVYDDVAFAPRNFGFPESEVEKRSMEALKAVHLTEIRNKQIYKLSGGEKKLVSIATILSTRPEIILLDEPTSGLDPKNRRNIINVMNELKVTKVIASHDLDFIMDTCSRTILIAEGKIIKDDKTYSILNDKELLENNGLELPLSLSYKNTFSNI